MKTSEVKDRPRVAHPHNFIFVMFNFDQRTTPKMNNP
jgi:hypothetical protein